MLRTAKISPRSYRSREKEMSKKEQRRLFFALWPSDTTRGQLLAISQGLSPLGGRTVPAENLHVTLAFLGPVAVSRQDCVENVARGLQAPGFQLLFDRIGCFPRLGIVWSGVSTVPRELVLLVNKLNQALGDCGFRLGERPFRPHVTLVRKANKPMGNAPHRPVVWSVTDFCLVESVTLPTGARYRVLKRWPLSE